MPVPTPRYYRVCSDASDIARSLEHEYLGVEHQFLAILRDRDAVPTQVLGELVDLDKVESRLLELLAWPGYRTASQGN
jgi:hypothetical protein